VSAEGDRANVEQLSAELGVAFRDPDLLERALTHRSYAFENGGLRTNERLEFLGDAVLAIVVTDAIFHDHPNAPEGDLARLRAAAVRASSLADVARNLGLGRYVRLGKGEEASGGRDKDNILADTFEAVLGAIYEDSGLDAAAAVVRGLFTDRLHELATQGAALDYKTSLQELAAAEYETLPRYSVVAEGPDHEKIFTARVEIAGQDLGTGKGKSKKDAEQAAAREAYTRIQDAGSTI
jgi:ribonuclease-3